MDILIFETSSCFQKESPGFFSDFSNKAQKKLLETTINATHYVHNPRSINLFFKKVNENKITSKINNTKQLNFGPG